MDYDYSIPRSGVTRLWPRAPGGRPIVPASSALSIRDPNRGYGLSNSDDIPTWTRGKQTSNGIRPWGHSLADFYHVVRCPTDDMPHTLTVMSGSELMQWAKANGELNSALEEIMRAEEEPEPKKIELISLESFLYHQEDQVRTGEWGKSIKPMDPDSGPVIPEVIAEKNHSFNLSKLPSPWPLVPFTCPTTSLQKFIPHEYLPRKLVVHDPWNLLAVNATNQHGKSDFRISDVDWEHKNDIVHIFQLNNSLSAETHDSRLSKPSIETCGLHRSEARMDMMHTNDMKKFTTGGYVRTPLGSMPSGPIPPPVVVIYGPIPQVTHHSPIGDAHLYLSPAHYIGQGNHSVLLSAEWELPREALLPTAYAPVMCRACTEVEVEVFLRERVEELGEPGIKEPTILKRRSAGDKTQASSNARSSNNSSIGEEEIGSLFVGNDGTYVKGPIQVFRTSVAWQNSYAPTCKHLIAVTDVPPTPLTARVNVVAKMSICGDQHLRREARNYQRFPKHMFEHWTGFNKLRALADPVPVGALVPQFYGYYEPSDPSKNGYLSPILLMEHCGKEITTRNLTFDERKECGSLILRFHEAGWVHGSLYPRNILVQPGPLDVARGHRSAASFRLIDFGRSTRSDNHEESIGRKQKSAWRRVRKYEEAELVSLFGRAFPGPRLYV